MIDNQIKTKNFLQKLFKMENNHQINGADDDQVSMNQIINQQVRAGSSQQHVDENFESGDVKIEDLLRSDRREDEEEGLLSSQQPSNPKKRSRKEVEHNEDDLQQAIQPPGQADDLESIAGSVMNMSFRSDWS